MRDRINICYILLMFEFYGTMIMHVAPRNDLYYAFAITINALMLKVLERGCHGKRIWFDIFRLTFIQFSLQFVGWILYRLRINADDFYNPSICVIVAVTFLCLLFEGTDDKLLARPRGIWVLFGDFGLGGQQTARNSS